MQTWPDSNNRASKRQGLGKITTYALLCFALAGLIIGFALGGFAGHTLTSTAVSSNTPRVQTPSIAQRTPKATPTPTLENILPGNPVIGPGDYTSPEKADGTTSYKLSALIVNKGTNSPIQVNDVTCRLWLTRDARKTQSALSANNYALPKGVNSFNQPFPEEEEDALEFSHSSQQVQPCVANGKTTWTYTLSPDLRRGSYYLAVLADWKGQHYNWYMVQINAVRGSAEEDS